MLTVKHVKNGTERIYPAPHGVEYVGPHANWGIGGPHLSIPQHREAPGLGVDCVILHQGTGYVMNENGATVGAYQLGDPPQSSSMAASAGSTA